MVAKNIEKIICKDVYMQHVYIYTQSPKINKVFPIYEYQTCV